MGHDIKLDPAIERWAHLRENTHLYFRWNKTTAGRSFLWLVAVPIGLTYLAAQTQVNKYLLLDLTHSMLALGNWQKKNKLADSLELCCSSDQAGYVLPKGNCKGSRQLDDHIRYTCFLRIQLSPFDHCKKYLLLDFLHALNWDDRFIEPDAVSLVACNDGRL